MNRIDIIKKRDFMTIKTADIVLVYGEGFFSFLIKIGNWFGKFLNLSAYPSIGITHVGIMVNDRDIVEALSNGVTLRPFPYTKNYKIYSLERLTDEEREIIKHAALIMVGAKYSWYQLFFLAVIKIFHIEWIFKGIGHNGQICSRVVGAAYSSIRYYFNNEALDVADPSDLAEHILGNSEWKLVS